jgi:predicted RNase H-like HicB family nuclease
MLTHTRSPFVSVLPTPEGIYRATCPSIAGISADGVTPEEAEQNLLEMLENRIEQTGPIGKVEPVEFDPDATDLSEEL